ncbi:DEKNAAC104623 [Brettanomyces naardenensis]|uniref:DEKNAAC104623 n=1 Tax=Brettanomyces naardenensis TaxID=13370 RepID=A0A448YR71_BRENA|nr:DEKNAAC104623 [Brettanomyces naardenensis]
MSTASSKRSHNNAKASNNFNKGSTRTGSRNRNSGRHTKRYNNDIESNDVKDLPPLLSDDDIMLERSIMKSSKKGLDISHLLDFTIADDESRQLESIETSSHPRFHGRRRSSNRRMPDINLSGRNYINVNYKFIVDYRADYKAQMLDPNLPLEDNTIIRVIVNGKDYQCPICLGDEFIAPRMTRCGHIFCYPCLMRLFSSSAEAKNDGVRAAEQPGSRTATCPLCNELIRERHRLLPVLINHEEDEKLAAGELITLNLMYRSNSNILAQPFLFYLEDSEFNGSIPWIEKGSTTDDFFKTSKYVRYSRIMKCDVDFIVGCFEQELSSIESHKLYDKEVYHDSGVYYDIAKINIDVELDAVKTSFKAEKGGPVSAPSYHHKDSDTSTLTTQQIEQLLVKQNDYKFDDNEKGYFFYQHQVGSNSKVKYFLSSLDIQILKAMYGDYSNFPFTLTLNLENISFDDGMVTEEMIRRLKYLGHLPIGTEVGFLELDWIGASSRLMPPEIYGQFKKRLKDRARHTRSKRLKEDRNKKTFEKELELKTLKFYSSENNLPLEEYGYKLKQENEFNNFPSRRSSADAVQPSLNATYEENALASNGELTGATDGSQDDGKNKVHYSTSVWGTKVPVLEEEAVEGDDYDDIERALKAAKEEQQRKGKKGRKGKKIILSFN